MQIGRRDAVLVARRRGKAHAGAWRTAGALGVDHVASCDKARGIARDCGLAVPSPAKPGRGRRVRFEGRRSGATRRAGRRETKDSRFGGGGGPGPCCRQAKISPRTAVFG